MDLKEVPIRTMDYDSFLEIPKDYYEKTDILDLKDIHLKFTISKNGNQEDVLSIECSGSMVLEDARSLEPVLYPFQISLEEKIDESSDMCGRFLTNSQNTLDIMSILWENIVLGIPISYTVSESLENMKNDSWRVVGNESENKIDPRLAPLLELLEKEKE